MSTTSLDDRFENWTIQTVAFACLAIGLVACAAGCSPKPTGQKDTGDVRAEDTADGDSVDSGAADTGRSEDTGQNAPDVTPCSAVVVCCVHGPTGKTCRYPNPCEAPAGGGDWSCGSSKCFTDAGNPRDGGTTGDAGDVSCP